MSNVESSAQTFAFAIQNPMTYIGGSTNWSSQDTSANYLWNDKNVARETEGKSIFDPSPIGWKLPILGVWSDFSANCAGVSDNIATYTLGTTGAATTPATGYRHPSTSNTTTAGTNARYWAASPASVDRGQRLTIATSAATASELRTMGIPVRPIRE